jgi:hypothetical protein
VQHSDDHKYRKTMESLRASLTMLAFGLGLLALLVAIDRPHWFVLRPASGTAAAMSHASGPPAGGQAAVEAVRPSRAD